MKSSFPTTQWTEFFALRDSSDPDARRIALGYLYQRYWQPLYAYLRRRGFDAEQAADLLQGFFTLMLDRDVVDRLNLTGRLRAYLLAMLKNYVANQLDRQSAVKRQPTEGLLSLDVETAERRYREVPSADLGPEEFFERRWAMEMVERAEERLAKHEANAGRAELYSKLREHVIGDSDAPAYDRIAASTGTKEVTLKVRVHRLRKRLGRMLREDIAFTVNDPAQVEDEVRYLLSRL